jgi:hypothetical protein
MNIRCAFCQTPYTLSRVAMLDALQEMDSKNLTHYDAHCPRCRRATQIPRQRMEMAMPKWREELKEFEAEMRRNPQQEAPAPAPEPAPVAETASKPEPQAPKKPIPAEAKATTASPKAKKATAAPKEKKATKKSK